MTSATLPKNRLYQRALLSAIFFTLFTSALFGQSYSTTLVTPSDTESRAVALNQNGAVAGSFQSVPGTWHAFLFDGKFVDLGTLGGAQSEATSINAAGDVVGDSDAANSLTRHAFLYHAGQMYDLNGAASTPAGITLTSAAQINDAGQILATSTDGGSASAYLLAPLTPNACAAGAAPAAPVLQLWPTPAGCFALTAWSGTLPPSTSLLSPSAQASTATQSLHLLAFDSRGDGVGYAGITASQGSAVLVSNNSSEVTDLNTLIRMDSGWTLNTATSINDYGQIVGNGNYQGHLQAFLLTPLQLAGKSALASALASSTASPLSAAGVPAIAPQAASPIPLNAAGTAGGVLSGEYPNPLLAGIAAGPVVFGNGTGTIGQNSSFAFNPATSQLSLTSGSNIYKTAAFNLTKGLGSSSALDLLEVNNTGKFLRILQPSDQAKITPTVYIDNGAGLYMRSWLTVSGTTNGLTGDGYSILPPSNDPLMLGIWADVATGLQVRTANTPGGYNYSNLDRHGNYTMSIEEDGAIRWGTGTRAAMDTGLSRNSAGVVQVNSGTEGSFGDLKARNVIATGAVQFMNTATGAGAASLASNSPAVNPLQPATWISVSLPDGSTGYVPVWK